MDSRATEIFNNWDFIEKYYINTYKLLKSVLVYDIDSIFNKNSQIFEVVDVVLHYQLYFKQALLVVSSLDKQDLILGFI